MIIEFCYFGITVFITKVQNPACKTNNSPVFRHFSEIVSFEYLCLQISKHAQILSTALAPTDPALLLMLFDKALANAEVAVDLSASNHYDD